MDPEKAYSQYVDAILPATGTDELSDSELDKVGHRLMPGFYRGAFARGNAYPGDKVKKGIDDETGPTPKEKEAAEDRARLRAKICGHTLFGKAQACGGLDTCDKAAAASYKMGMANYEAKARGEIDEMRDAQHHSLSQDLAEARAQNSVNLARAQAQAPGGPGGPSPYD